MICHIPFVKVIKLVWTNDKNILAFFKMKFGLVTEFYLVELIQLDDNYENLDVKRSYLIPGTSISIRFTDFNLEGSFTCSFDSVRVGSKR